MSGDDDGWIRLWDYRQGSSSSSAADLCVKEFKEHEGTIADIQVNNSANLIVTASCDGRVGIFDL